MLSLDPTTRAEYDAAETPSARAAVVMAAITGTVTATVYDGSDVARGSGTMQTPWASIEGTRLVIGELADFMVTSGGTPDANWYLAFEAGARWMRGSFGLSGADFNWSLPTFATGQGGRLGTVEVQPQGYEPVDQDYIDEWDVLGYAQASLSPSWSVADGSAQALNADAVPNPIKIYQGQTFDFADYIVGGVPPYSVALGSGSSLPLGVTKTGPTTLYADIDAPTTEGTPIELLPEVTFDIDDSAVAATLPKFGVLSSVGGTNLPFAFGHVFKQGDVPSGSYVDSDLTDWQCTPVTRWPDGSLKHAIIAGRATCSAQVLRAAQLSVAGTDRAGTALTTADLAAALPAVTVQGGSQVITLNDLVATPHRTVLTGPIMSQWQFRAPVPGSNHLVVLFELRLYKGGRVELFPPKVENGYLLVPGGADDTRTWTLTIGGVVQYSASINIKYASNVHLLDNSASTFKHFSYWIGGDPQIEPRHDAAYLQSTGAVPPFGWNTPSEATLNGLQQSYTPNTLVGLQGFKAGGNSAAPLGHTGNKADALYAISADARAYRGMMALAMSSGSWSVHRRDETTNEPIAFSSYPLASLNTQNTPVIPAFTGDVNGFLPSPATSHQPTFAYLAWLMTGRWAFLDEIKFWATNNYLWQTQAARNNADGRLRPDAGANTDRGSAWGLRTLAQLLFSLPTELPSPRAPDATFAADILNSWEKNVAWFHGAVITGTELAGAYVNDLGLWPGYYTRGSSVYTAANGYPSDAGAMWNVAGWMQMMLTIVWGYTWDMDLPVSAGTKSQHQAIRDHGYKLPVGVSGAGDPNEWNYRWFGPYDLVAGLKAGPTWFADWNEAYDTAVGELGAPPADNTLLRTYGTDLTKRWGPTPDVYLTSFFGQHHAALAYAVEHGAPGASAAWARITAATNYSEYTAGFLDSPSYGIVPRSA